MIVDDGHAKTPAGVGGFSELLRDDVVKHDLWNPKDVKSNKRNPPPDMLKVWANMYSKLFRLDESSAFAKKVL